MGQQHRLGPPDASPKEGQIVGEFLVPILRQPQGVGFGLGQLHAAFLILLNQQPLCGCLFPQIDAYLLEKGWSPHGGIDIH